MRTLRFVGVESGGEVGRLELGDDGEIRGTGSSLPETVITQVMDRESLTRPAAFASLAADGWTNASLMIALDDLDPQ